MIEEITADCRTAAHAVRPRRLSLATRVASRQAALNLVIERDLRLNFIRKTARDRTGSGGDGTRSAFVIEIEV